MEKYYHFTSYDSLDSISKKGLVPKTGERCKSIGDKRCSIFLSKGISNVIKTYISFLWHYMSLSGETGKKVIEKNKFLIKMLKAEVEKFNRFGIPQENNGEIEFLESEIEMINQLLNYNSFNEYISDGCYLSVSDVDDIVSDNPADCLCNRVIEPSKINIVALRDKKTDELIDSREKVLSYFMSNVSKTELIEKESDSIGKRMIADLYNDRNVEINEIYNDSNFSIEEIPIKKYKYMLNKQ